MDYSNIPDISFIEDTTVEQVLEQMISDYQSEYFRLTDKRANLSLANPYRLILYGCAVQIYQAMQYIDRAGKMNLPRYSYGDYLDNLSTIWRIQRKEAAAAQTLLRFTIDAPIASVVAIPKGCKVTNNNGVFFTTDEYAEIAAGETSVEVTATCTETGLVGKVGAGELIVVVNILPYVVSVTNIGDSYGASDREFDEDYKERIFGVPKSYSVAGPTGAYEYHTRDASSEIGDVLVGSEIPGEVDVYFTMADGSIPSDEMKQFVGDFLDDETKRPLTDKVNILTPSTKEYTVEIKYFIRQSDTNKVESIQRAVDNAVSDYNRWQTEKIGRDINPSQLIRKVMEAGAKRVEVTTPEFEVVSASTIPRTGEVNILYGGVEND